MPFDRFIWFTLEEATDLLTTKFFLYFSLAIDLFNFDRLISKSIDLFLIATDLSNLDRFILGLIDLFVL